MNKKMENVISKDLGMGINKIRKLSWEELDKLPKKMWERSYMPKDRFVTGGNINLTLNRIMGIWGMEFRNNCRRVVYRTKCLIKHKKNV